MPLSEQFDHTVEMHRNLMGADIAKNFIYFRSPIAKALIGKKKKDLITVTTPSGEKNFEIIEVKYI